MTQHTIRLEGLLILRERLEFVNERAARMGQPPLQLQINRQWTADGFDEAGRKVTRDWVDYTILGTPPRIGGWNLVAAIEHTPSGNVVKLAPRWASLDGTDLAQPVWDRTEDPAWRTAEANCDHCGTARRRRKTVILEDANGARKQVGLQCVRDFIGYDIPDAFTYPSLGLDDLDNAYGLKAAFGYGIRQIVAYAFAAIRTHGWAKADSVDVLSTAYRVEAWLDGDPEHMQRCGWRDGIVEDADWTSADEAMRWVCETPATDPDTFRLNLRVLILEGRADRKLIKMYAAMAYSYHRHNQRMQRPQVPAPQADVVAGPAVTIAGQVLNIKTTETPYGERRVMTVHDDRGFTVWGSVPTRWLNDAAFQPAVGDRVVFLAEVRASDRDATFGFYKRPRNATKG